MKLYFVYFFSGVTIGAFGWIFGNSWIPPFILKLVSGFGWLLLISIAVAFGLGIAASRDPERFGTVANAALSFSNRKLAKSAAVLFGLAATALTCWLSVGCEAALATLLLGVLLAGVLSFLWHGLNALKVSSESTND